MGTGTGTGTGTGSETGTATGTGSGNSTDRFYLTMDIGLAEVAESYKAPSLLATHGDSQE